MGAFLNINYEVRIIKVALCIKDYLKIKDLYEMGYDGYEYSGAALASMTDAEFSHMLAISNDIGLPCVGINAYASGKPAFVGDSYSPAESAAYADLLCFRANKLGAPNAGVGSPKSRMIPEGYDETKADEQFTDFIRVTSDTASRYSMGILVEALRSSSCNYINTAADAVKIVNAANRDNVKLVYDFYHALTEETDYIKSFEKYFSLIGHVHLSTCEPDKTRGYPTERDNAEYVKIAEVLKKTGYNGYISVEPTSYDKEMARRCVMYLKTL